MNALKARKKTLIIVSFVAPIVAIIPFAANSGLDFGMRIALVVAIFCVVSALCNAWLYNAPLTVVEQFPIANGATILGLCCGAGALGSCVFNQFTGSIPQSA